MFEWSSHYWRIVHDVVNSKIKYDGQRKSLYFSRTPLSSTLDCDSLLAEAQLALANAALYKHDTSQALKYFSQVNTPQAAWNQSQVCTLYSWLCSYYVCYWSESVPKLLYSHFINHLDTDYTSSLES